MGVDIAAIKLMKSGLSPSQYIGVFLPHVKNMKMAQLDEVLPFETHEFDHCEPLAYLANSKNLSPKAKRWLATIASCNASMECFKELCAPFFEMVFCEEITKDIADESIHVFHALGQNDGIVGICLKGLEDFESFDIDDYFVPGMIAVLGFSGQKQHAQRLSRFLHDHGYWDLIVKNIFEKEPLQKKIEILDSRGVLAPLENALVEAGGDRERLADLLSKDTDLQRHLASLVSSNSFLINALKLVLDRKAVGEVVSDKDIHCRRAAAFAMRYMPNLDDVEPLKNGLGDADKHVRRYCLEALSHHIGNEKVKELLGEMEKDATSIKKSAEELSGFLGDKFKEVVSGAKETTGKVFGSVGDKVSGLFRRDKE